MRMDTRSMMTNMRLRSTTKAGPMTALMRMLPTSKKTRQPLSLTSTLRPSTLIRMTRLLLHTWMLVEGFKTWSSVVDFCQLWHWLTRTLRLLPPVLHLPHGVVEKALESQRGNRRARAVDPMLCDTHHVVNAKLQILEPELQQPHNVCDAVLLDIKQLSALDLQNTVVPLRCQPALQRSRTQKAWPQPSCLMNMDTSYLRTNLDALASIAPWWTQEQVPFWWALAHSTVMWSISSSLDLPWKPLRCGALAGLFTLAETIQQSVIGLLGCQFSSTTILDLPRRSSPREKHQCWWAAPSLKPWALSSTSSGSRWCSKDIHGDKSQLVVMANTCCPWLKTTRPSLLIRCLPLIFDLKTNLMSFSPLARSWIFRPTRSRKVSSIPTMTLRHSLESDLSWSSTGRCSRMPLLPKRNASMPRSPENFMTRHQDPGLSGKSMLALQGCQRWPNHSAVLLRRLGMRPTMTLTFLHIGLTFWSTKPMWCLMRSCTHRDVACGAGCKQSMQPLKPRKTSCNNSDRSTMTTIFDLWRNLTLLKFMVDAKHILNNHMEPCPGKPPPWNLSQDTLCHLWPMLLWCNVLGLWWPMEACSKDHGLENNQACNGPSHVSSLRWIPWTLQAWRTISWPWSLSHQLHGRLPTSNGCSSSCCNGSSWGSKRLGRRQRCGRSQRCPRKASSAHDWKPSWSHQNCPATSSQPWTPITQSSLWTSGITWCLRDCHGDCTTVSMSCLLAIPKAKSGSSFVIKDGEQWSQPRPSSVINFVGAPKWEIQHRSRAEI